MKLTPAEIWAEYQEAAAFNQEVNLYDTVKRNEKFYIGEQWYGADVPKGMDKPVFNILKRVVAYFISTIVSDDIAAQVEAFQAGNRYDEFLKIVGDEISRVIENTKFKSKNREILRSAAVDGDAYGCP